MENGNYDASERGRRSPLLDKESQSSNIYEDNESVEAHQRSKLQSTPAYSKALPIILGFSFLEGTAFNGIGINLVLYLGSVLHGSTSSNAANVAVWGGTTYFTPLLGGFLADTYWGNYKTMFISVIFYLLGMIIVTLSTAIPSFRPPPCDGSSCQPATGAQMFIFYFGLYLIALGCGGTRSALLPFGADQFNDENPVEVRKKVSFFSWFYVCSMVGVLVAGILIVWIQENISWTIGFGIATLCMAIAAGGFTLGTPAYKLRMPTGSPMKSVLQVAVASLRKMQLEAPTDAKLLYEVNQDGAGQKRLAHTDEFRFLDKAAITSDLETSKSHAENSWTLCTITQVEELKILIRMLPIWATSIVYSAACTQMNSTFIQQGSVMDTKVGSFSIPPASLSSFGVICVMVWVFIYNMLIAPAIQRRSPSGTGLSNLQRMGIGRFTMIISMITAAVVEAKRLESVRKGQNISIAWQFPQYFIISGSEVFNYITQLEFFYTQAPDTMRSICTSFALLSTALGNYLSSLIITVVSAATASDRNPGWIPDDLNKGHLDYYFYSLAVMCSLNFCVYVVFAMKYKLKKVIQES
ncbi:protein NRT1/ PTR FAMILY 8.3-like [Canna indica]|uniref:Protein NRT1/ PTR FAMILY 8.3-like n=1 Tax=Canna indica TaxID=4628 RepID=A0AAQ3KBN1_9LILI|nr:protein NRT1/ PTR FAMILY 8.3-like [Canna indica]